MTREKFIKVLDRRGYSYKIKGDKIVITDDRYVDLLSLKTIPPDVEFMNKWDVNLKSLEALSPSVKFRNRGYVYLDSLKTIPPGVEFTNGSGVYLESITGGYFDLWNGNIEGIDPNSLLNKMIELGLFDRRR